MLVEDMRSSIRIELSDKWAKHLVDLREQITKDVESLLALQEHKIHRDQFTDTDGKTSIRRS